MAQKKKYITNVRTVNGRYPCLCCAKQFAHKTNLGQHLLTHIKSLQHHLRCKVCDKAFVSSFLVARHMRTVHNEAKMKQCDCCGAKFRFLQGLKTHKCPNGYTSRQPVICDVCGEVLGCEEYLKSHKLRKHEGVKFDKRRYRKSVFCEMCGKQMNKDHLKTHMNIHLNIKPYACTYCVKAFVSKGRLDEHLRTHTGDRPYSCDICGKGFTQRHCVKTHKESVHGTGIS